MRFLFEDVVLDTDRRELRRGGVLQRIEPQAFDLLEFLIRNRDRVVTKSDLFKGIWKDRIVSDSALSTRINAARSAVGDSGKHQRLIKTFLRRGVRFIGDVRLEQGSYSANDHEPATGPGPSRDRDAHPHALLPPASLPSIAVLPFRTLEDGVVGYFGDGMVEDIVVSLASLHELFVISRGSTLAFRGAEVDAATVGKSLGVRYVVSGSVRRSGDALRIWIELCDAASGETIWTDKIRAGLGDLFNIQDRIVEDTVSRIAPNVRRAELKRALRKQPESLSAYDCVLRALDLIYKLERKEFDNASELLLKARQIDQTFALPYAWSAWTHMYRVAFGWSADEKLDINAATRLAEEALRLDSQNARALATYGHLSSFLHHDYEAAAHYLSDALNSCPNDPLCWALSSASASYTGHGRDAVERAEKALRLSPFDTYRFYYVAVLALAHYVAGQHEQAIKWGRIAMRENPAFTPNLRYLTAALVAAEKLQEARDVARLLIQRQPNFTLRHYEATFMPFQGTRERKVHMDHLRAAGLPKG